MPARGCTAHPYPGRPVPRPWPRPCGAPYGAFEAGPATRPRTPRRTAAIDTAVPRRRVGPTHLLNRVEVGAKDGVCRHHKVVWERLDPIDPHGDRTDDVRRIARPDRFDPPPVLTRHLLRPHHAGSQMHPAVVVGEQGPHFHAALGTLVGLNRLQALRTWVGPRPGRRPVDARHLIGESVPTRIAPHHLKRYRHSALLRRPPRVAAVLTHTPLFGASTTHLRV